MGSPGRGRMTNVVLPCEAGPLSILAVGQTHRFRDLRGWAPESTMLKL